MAAVSEAVSKLGWIEESYARHSDETNVFLKQVFDALTARSLYPSEQGWDTEQIPGGLTLTSSGFDQFVAQTRENLAEIERDGESDVTASLKEVIGDLNAVLEGVSSL